MMTSTNFAVCLGIFFLIVSSSAEKAPYKSFVKNATSAPSKGHYDYIIIGGGAAGIPLAATLSASAKVLLLERGGLPYDYPDVVRATGFLNSLTDTSPSSASQTFVSTDGVISHRARVLGGGTAINAGFYTRASRGYATRAGWEPGLVEASYEWVERKVAFRPRRLASWQEAVREGLLDAGVKPDNGFTLEHLPGTKTGATIFNESGIRHTAADLLEYASPNNITVYLHATVHRIVFTTSGRRSKAYGAMFQDSNGNKHIAYLNKGNRNEIILSAGALGSPQLLMLSGIGPGPELKARGIDIVLNQPMVGQGMSDNPMNGFIIPSRRSMEPSLAQVVGITDIEFYIEALNAQFDPSAIFANQKKSSGHEHAFVGGKVAGPFSKGHMELQSRDPNDNPIVTFNYFNDSRDLAKCVQGMEILKRVVESPAISAFRYPNSTVQSLLNHTLSIPINLRRKHKSSVYNMEMYCKDTVITIWHYHGGCQVDRVVDRDYRVLGVDALRIVDGSTLNYSPGTNPQATLMMLGRYMGQKILREGNSHIVV